MLCRTSCLIGHCLLLQSTFMSFQPLASQKCPHDSKQLIHPPRVTNMHLQGPHPRSLTYISSILESTIPGPDFPPFSPNSAASALDLLCWYALSFAKSQLIWKALQQICEYVTHFPAKAWAQTFPGCHMQLCCPASATVGATGCALAKGLCARWACRAPPWAVSGLSTQSQGDALWPLPHAAPAKYARWR